MDAKKKSKNTYSIPDCPANCRAWHSVNQVAVILSVGRDVVYKLMREGKMRFEEREIGRRVRHDWVDEYMSGQGSALHTHI